MGYLVPRKKKISLCHFRQLPRDVEPPIVWGRENKIQKNSLMGRGRRKDKPCSKKGSRPTGFNPRGSGRERVDERTNRQIETRLMLYEGEITDAPRKSRC